MTVAEAIEIYGQPVAWTGHGKIPVWLIDGVLVYADDLLDITELGCAC